MDSDYLNKQTVRKVKFAPKAPPKRAPKPEVKTEVVEQNDAIQAMDLLRRINECGMKPKAKHEKKATPSQIAFGYGGKSVSIKSFGIPKHRNESNGNTTFTGGTHGEQNERKEYKEPWDYYSHYPTTLPLRRPYSGDPEFLDEEEFGMATVTATYDENATNNAMELGLLEDNEEPRAIFLQLPSTLPTIKQPLMHDSHAVTTSSGPSARVRGMEKTQGLDEYPAGLMGKMVVYRNGAVKLKLGDIVFDVSPGLDTVFAQDVVAMNTTDKHCSMVGELKKRAVLTPDLDSVLSSMNDF